MRRKSPKSRAWFLLLTFAALFAGGKLEAAQSSSTTPNDSYADEQYDSSAGEEYVTEEYVIRPEVVTYSAALCPRSYAWAEGLILGRENCSDDRALVLDLNTGEVLLTTDDLDFDWTGGLRVGYGERDYGCWGWEVAYLGVFDQEASDDVELDDSLMLPGDLGLAVNNFFGADDVDVEYSSDLHSIEANAVGCSCACGNRSCHSIELLAGFRYLNLDEEFSISSFDSAEGTTEYSVDTENHLYGGQIGTRVRQRRYRWSWEMTGKAGVFGNDMEQNQDAIIDFPGFVFRPAQGSDETDVAFVGDLNFTVIWQVFELWGLRAGYNLIWLDGVALAPDQLDFTNTPDSGRTLDADGFVFLHGVNLGLESRW